MLILLIDNYDSFTYNLVQAFGELGAEVQVRRNDAVTLEDIESLAPDRIVLSPGPGRPEDSGICGAVIRTFAARVPILGVCLGHQCIASVHGARIVRADRLMHGKTSWIHHDGLGPYRGLLNPFLAARYHSLIVDETSLPRGFLVTARSEQGELMGIRHESLLLEGVQFHPESFLCPQGPRLLANAIEASHDQLCRSSP